MTDYTKNFPDFYVTGVNPCPYLPDREERKLFTHLTADKPAPFIDNLLRNGFRRSQNIAYLPYCEGCTACTSIRIPVRQFQMSKSMKRIWNKNKDLVAIRVPAITNVEQYNLFTRYITQRHMDGGMADMTMLDYAMMVEDSVAETAMTEYRATSDSDGIKSGQLIGVTLTDHLQDGISLVYSFYDPNLPKRSLGSYMVMDHVRTMLHEGLDYVYLGYWIDGCKKMSYKTKFKPLEALTPEGWQPFSAD